MEIKLGKYRHYKGNEYEVIGTGFLTENREESIIYKQLYEGSEFPAGTFWIRNKKEFISDRVFENNLVPRFTPID